MYTNAQYLNNPVGEIYSIRVSIDGVISYVPIDPNNTDYKNIMQLVSSGELTIALESV